jgi:hypothetical protein
MRITYRDQVYVVCTEGDVYALVRALGNAADRRPPRLADLSRASNGRTSAVSTVHVVAEQSPFDAHPIE